MSSGARWTIGVVLIGIGLLFGAGFVSSAAESASQLSTTTDDGARHALRLVTAGQFLTGVGYLGVFVSVALTLIKGDVFRRLITVGTLVPGGRKGLRRARRQINGVEPYSAFEIVHLRRLAEYRVATRRLPAETWTTYISLITLFVGFTLAPPDIGDEFAWGPALLQVSKVLSVTLLVLLVALLAVGIVVQLRNRTDAKAEAFLQRTQPVQWPTDTR